MGNKLIDSTVVLLGGAGLGAALMYLFDPDQGTQRRGEVSSSAANAVSSTQRAIHSTLDAAGEKAQHLAGQARGYGHDLVDQLSSKAAELRAHATHLSDHANNLASGAVSSAKKSTDHASDAAHGYVNDVIDRGTQLRDRLLGRARDTRDQAAANVDDYWGRAKSKAGVNEPHHYGTAAGVTAGSIGVLALGAGLMYFLDPEKGHSRRAKTSQQLMALTNRAGKRARGLGRHLGNQMQGKVHDVRQQATEKWNTVRDAVAPETNAPDAVETTSN